MINRNSRFKKSGIVAIVGFIASVIAQIINFIDWQEAAGSMLTISLGITVIFAIYFTYYFTEALIMESNIQEKSAVTRNYQMTWLILSAAVFAYLVQQFLYIQYLLKLSLEYVLYTTASQFTAQANSFMKINFMNINNAFLTNSLCTRSVRRNEA